MIDAYVAELASVLSGPKRAKADLLAEARHSLIDSAEVYQRGGLCRAAAEDRAVAEFGGVAEVAPDYQAELSLTQCRRTALLVICFLAPQDLIWDHAPVAVGASLWYTWLQASMPWVGGLAIAGSVLAAVASGFGMRYLNPRRPIARTTAVFALVAAGFFTVCSLILAAAGDSSSILLGLRGLPLAVLFVVIPMMGVALSARRTLAAAA